MKTGIYALIPEERLQAVLGNLQAFTDLAIQLIDANGTLLMSFGKSTGYCAKLKQSVFDRQECFLLHRDAGKYAQAIGEAYVFSCHANLNHIAFPLISQNSLLGSVIIGPFLMDTPDSTLVLELSQRYPIKTDLCLELYDELSGLVILPPARVNQLKLLVEHLLTPLLPGERALLLQNQQKMYQQARLNETIQIYKEQMPAATYSNFFYHKEKELLAKVRLGNIPEVKALLNELIGYVLFSEGRNVDRVRTRGVELTILLSRVAMDCGAGTEGIFQLNSQFLTLLYQEQDLDTMCMTLQEALESFMQAIFYEKDKGNLHLRKALGYVAQHYSSHLEIAQVADYVGLSPGYFSTLFREALGISFREHLNRVRVEESKQLLLSTDYSLADIAIAIGFPDQSYFCKIFKKIVGLTPGKFRAR